MKTCPTCLAAYRDDVVSCPTDGARLRTVEALKPGTILRRKYEVVREIGRGGMGVVYLARHLLWNEDKAIKVLQGGSGAPGKRLEGLLAEALVMRQLLHPNIARVEDERLDDALKALEKFDPRKAQVVEMRYFGGLTAEEIASVLDLGAERERDWALAKAWLLREMTRARREPPTIRNGFASNTRRPYPTPLYSLLKSAFCPLSTS